MREITLQEFKAVDCYFISIVFLIISPSLFFLGGKWGPMVWLGCLLALTVMSCWLSWVPAAKRLIASNTNKYLLVGVLAYCILLFFFTGAFLWWVPFFSWDGLSFWLFHAVEGVKSCDEGGTCPKLFDHRHPNTVVHLFTMVALAQRSFEALPIFMLLTITTMANGVAATVTWLFERQCDSHGVLAYVLLLSSTPFFLTSVWIPGYAEFFLTLVVSFAVIKAIDALIAPSIYNYLCLAAALCCIFFFKNSAPVYVAIILLSFLVARLRSPLRTLLFFTAAVLAAGAFLSMFEFRITILGADVIWYGFDEGLKINSHRYIGPLTNFYIDVAGKRLRFDFENLIIIDLVKIFFLNTSFSILVPLLFVVFFLVPNGSAEQIGGFDEARLLRRFSKAYLAGFALFFIVLGLSDYGSKTMHLGGSRLAAPLFIALLPVIALLLSYTQRPPIRN